MKQQVLNMKDVCVCVCVCLYSCLTYPSCKSHIFCAVLPCRLSALNIFFTKDKIFGGKNTEHKMCDFVFSTKLLWNICISKKNSLRHCHKLMKVFMYSTRYSFQILIKLEFSRQILEKSSNIKFQENSWSGSRLIPWVQKDGQAWQT